MLEYHLIIKGRVQGVCYRWFTVENAKPLNIKGWVKNNINGTVEAILQGDRENIEFLIKKLKTGPKMAYVENIHITKQKISTEFNNFSVKY